jgi:hypothetical protein
MVKGDWAQTVSTLNSTVNWASPQPCWLCHAFQGCGPATMRYTCTTSDEQWSCTTGTRVPWMTPPSIIKAIGFKVSPSSVPPDCLHFWFLGIGRDLAASAVVALCDHRKAGSRALRLAAVNTDLKAWRLTNRIHMRFHQFTVGNLKWRGSAYPGLACKAADCRRLIEFLHSREEDYSFSPLLQIALRTAVQWASLLFSSGVFFSEEENAKFHSLTKCLARAYLALNLEAARRGRNMYKLRPKYHLLQHCLHFSGYNPHTASTWQCEDEVGKVMKIMRRLRPHTVEKRTLQRVWIGLPSRLSRTRGRFAPPDPKRRRVH